MIDYYNLLGVPPQASAAELRAAYRARAKRAHPDAHPQAGPGEREALKRRFIQLAQAYETLRDPARRRRYDREREAAQRKAAGAAGDRVPPGSGPGAGAGAATGARRWRSTRAHPPGGRPTSPPRDDEESLEALLRDVESLLGGFGLSLRQPFAELLEALFEWAKALLRQVLEGQEDAAAGAAPAGGQAAPGSTGEGRPRTGGQAGPQADRPRGAGPREGGRQGAPGKSEAALEAELAALRERVRRSGTAARPGAQEPSLEAQLRELKRRLGK